MTYSLLPDLIAMLALIAFMRLLRRKHPQQHVDIWLIGMFFIFVEAFAHIFYAASSGNLRKALHVISLDAYLLAGLTFTWATGRNLFSRRSRILFLSLNTIALLAILTLYGLDIRDRFLYDLLLSAGLVLGIGSSLYIRRSWPLAAVQLCGWLPLGYFVNRSDFRGAVYWALFCLYVIAAFAFHHSLPRKSAGKQVVLAGFLIWALVFLAHPWVVHYPTYDDIATQVWNMQKFLISIGMLFVMLEEQVTANEWLALHDALTGLPNRRLFEDRLNHGLERSRRTKSHLALLMLDLNGFKEINDSFGHQTGDQILREVAANLRATVRSSDTLARLGGDEFMIIVSDLGNDCAYSISRLIEAIGGAFEKPILIAGQSTLVTASLGYAIYPDEAPDAASLLNLADQRMYALKERPIHPNLDRNIEAPAH
jgi:diguanylate cyclase (GGDEF)-like protein